MVTITSFDDFEKLDTQSKYLVHKAKEATNRAYAPYSKFHVGAALLFEDETVIAGANQENASYPLCMCAERVALYTAAMLHPEKKILKLAVVAHKKNHRELTGCTCCGACRQVLLEFERRQAQPIEVIFLGADRKWFKFSSVAELLPLNFTNESLRE